MTEKTTKFENFVQIVICLFAIFLTGVLTLASIFSTTGMEIVQEGEGINNIVITIQQSIETVWYYHDNIFANLIWLVIGFAVCFAVMPFLKKVSFRTEIIFVSLWVIVLGCIWVTSSQVCPSEDSGTVATASIRASRDDFEWLELPYFSYYSYQLGYVLFNEILIRIHDTFKEPANLIYLEIMNVIFLAVTYAGILTLSKRLFKDERIHHLTAFLLLFSIQPIIFSVFLYGIYPGMMFAVWGIVFEVYYFQTEKIRFIPLSAVCIALAYLIKPNYLICLTAMMIIIFAKAVSSLKQPRKLILCLAYLVLSISLSFALPKSASSFYESRSGIKLKQSIPMTSFIAMGLNESGNAPGWYNYFHTITNFEIHNFDTQEASQASVEEIKNRLKYFSENKHYRDEFFYKKFVSQWNETSYQSIWNNKVRMQYQEKGKLSEWVCNDGEQKTKAYMDIYTQLIFAGVLLGSIACLRKKELMQIIFPLVIIGGMMYHLMAESKSQYAMPYYILMTGFTAVGICWLYDKLMPSLEPKLLALKSKCKSEKRSNHERTEQSDQNQQVSEPDSPAQSADSGN